MFYGARKIWWILILGNLGLLFFLTLSHAQESPKTKSAVEDPVAQLEQRLQVQKKQLETAQIDESVRKQILDLYAKIDAELQTAKSAQTRARDNQNLIEKTPATLLENKQKLDQSLPPARPQPPTDTSVSQLDQFLAQARVEYNKTQSESLKLDDIDRQRTERRKLIPQETADLQKIRTQIQEQRQATPSDQQPRQLTQAHLLGLDARALAVNLQLDALQKEIASYEARRELLVSRRELAARQVKYYEDLVNAWQKLVNDKRREQTKSDAQQAKELKNQVDWAHKDLKSLASENARIAERRLLEKLPDKIEKTTRELDDTTKKIETYTSDFKNLNDKLKAIGLTREMSLRLRKMREGLPDVRQLRKTVRTQLNDLGDIQVRIIEIQEQSSPYENIQPLIQSALTKISTDVKPELIPQIETNLRKLYTDRWNYYTALEHDYDTYFEKLASLIEKERTLAEESENIAHFIDERVLWIRSTTVLTHQDLSEMRKAFTWLFKPANGKEFLLTLWHAALAAPAKCIAGLLYILVWIFLRRRLGKPLKDLGKIAARTYTYTFVPTLKALGITFLMILPGPVILGWLYWLLVSYPDTPETTRTIAEGIKAMALALLLIETLRNLCRVHGLAHNHFAWPEIRRIRIRRNLRGFAPLVLPLLFIVAALEWRHDNAWQNSLGRLAFILMQLLFVIIMYRIFRIPPIPTTDQHAGEAIRFSRIKLLKFYLLLAAPTLLAALAFIGYYYTAVQLAQSLWATLWLFLILFILNDFALRWILVSQRNLAIKKARKKREALLEKLRQENQSNESPAEVPLPPEPELDLSSISDQTKNLLHSVIIFTLLLGLWFVWTPVIPALGILNSITIKGAVTLGNVLFAILILLIAFFIGRNLPGLLEIAILQKLPLQTGVSFAVTSITKYIITIIGVIIAFDAIGIGWSKVQWLAAAVTVGLGFGLQEIFANFVSGLIILFERPIRVGDIVSVGTVDGKITRIRMRATTITDWDRRELLVPNKEFITSQLINWTLSDPITRVVIPVGIAYGSDTEKARDLLLQTAQESAFVLKEPKPQAIFRRFGESSLDFELRVFIRDREYWPKLIHEVHTKIDQAFRQANIEIAFPQQDIHVRSIHDFLPVENRNPNPTDIKN
jgi:potassium-dependent mechanosensitive channel